jgi:hypothetical protein
VPPRPPAASRLTRVYLRPHSARTRYPRKSGSQVSNTRNQFAVDFRIALHCDICDLDLDRCADSKGKDDFQKTRRPGVFHHEVLGDAW